MAQKCEKCLLIMVAVAVAINVCTVLIFYQILQTNEAPRFSSKELPLLRPKSRTVLRNENDINPIVNIWLAGIVIDVNIIVDQVMDVIQDLNCQYDVGVHIITKNNSSEENRKLQNKNPNSCGPLIILQEEEEVDIDQNEGNRIDRISELRDYQRNILKNFAQMNENSIIILIDLDLLQIPSADDIWTQIQELQKPSYPHDSICALGTKINVIENPKKKKKEPLPFYYDTYATVFLPDTFSHPLSRRLIPHYYSTEDPNFVRSDDPMHGFTQVHIWNHFKTQGPQSDTGNVQVKSCFGGLTMYRSVKYFEPKCKYKLEGRIVNKLKDLKDVDKEDTSISESIMRYASNKEIRPCEHIVLHDCFAKRSSNFNIALNPKLLTIWKRR